jgi:hypothetical protein
MIGESLVVMERGARFPNWIDTMTGSESNVRVLAQRDRESEHAFEARIIDFLERFATVASAPTRALLACGPERGRARTTSRAVLILALRELVARRSGSVIVIEPADADPSIAELARLLSAELVRDSIRTDDAAHIDEPAQSRVA